MTRNILVAAFGVLALTSEALAAGIADLPWDDSNIEQLRSLSKQEVVQFINELPDGAGDLTANDVLQFRWADLSGDRIYQLVIAENPGPCCVYVIIYHQQGLGKVTREWFDGGGNLHSVIRDLNADGKDELVIQTRLGTYRGASPTAVWPAIYQLKDGKYVEASRDFPNFYDDEVLPEFQDQIAETQKQIATGLKGEAQLAVLEMSRDKILRVLGRDPTAGLAKARAWADSANPDLVGDAIAVLRDIGGHEDELRAAELAGQRVMAAEKAARMGQ